MKFAIITYIALGLTLSLVLGIEYDCEGKEMFPIYYGSPFVFMRTSLASSLEFYYSVSGLFLNILIWGFLLFFIDKGIQNLIQRVIEKRWPSILYKTIIGCMIVFATLYIAIQPIMNGGGFGKGSNYWYWNLDKEAKTWRMKCKGEIIIFGL